MSRAVRKRVLKTIIHMKQSKYHLKPHQIEGLKWLLKKEIHSNLKGGLLCDDAGMGKTIQMGALIYSHFVDTTLLVVPVAVLHQWKMAMSNIFGSDNIYVHFNANRFTNWEKLRSARLGNMQKLIVLTTYGIVTNSKTNGDNLLFDHAWGRVILDEGQIIRNSKTKCFKKVNKLKRTYSWILSGTPVQNSERDIRNLFKFITNQNSVRPLSELISKYLLRRTKSILTGTQSELRNYTTYNYIVPFKDKSEQDTYNMIHKDTLNECNSDVAENKCSIEILEKLLRLRQATAHINIAIRSFQNKFNLSNMSCISKQSSKLHKMGEVISKVVGLSLIFCQYHSEMKEVGYELTNRKITYEIYNGSMNHIQRQKVLRKFTADSTNGPTALIIQIKAGGVGLNLQQFSNIFILSPDWNPSNEIQAIARAHRIGQTKKVNVFKFTVVSNPKFEDKDKDNNNIRIQTIDEYIVSTQKNKRLIMAELLDDSSLIYNESNID